MDLNKKKKSKKKGIYEELDPKEKVVYDHGEKFGKEDEDENIKKKGLFEGVEEGNVSDGREERK